MKRFVLALALAGAVLTGQAAEDPQRQAWLRHAQAVTITRDDWGIAHVHGKTDADTVFGLIYAQAEDDFPRIETNYLNALGRLAEAEGEGEVFRDLRMRLFVDPDRLKARYLESPPWLQQLMDAWAGGLNFYLATHPSVTPRVLTRVEPWMALSYTEGSIGGDIERISLAGLEAFYGARDRGPSAPAPPLAASAEPVDPTGSNGFALSPAVTASHHALLWINPHTSFFFRSELQATSDEGLNAYGAVTWGQFFVYQGFNDRLGWMHTSSGVDNVDEYLEQVSRSDAGYVYRYGTEQRPVRSETVTIAYRTPSGLANRRFTVYRTHHGPIVREAEKRWVAVRLLQEPAAQLIQSFTRTKARTLQAFRQVMDLHTNSSNNTVYADADGNIAYFHSNFIPKRDTRFDWTKPVDGSDPATEWGPPLSIDETPGVVNPPTGWIQNTNNWPFSVAGSASPRKDAFPAYVESGGENPRGVHAVQVLSGRTGFTMETLVAAAFDPLLTEFQLLVPRLVQAWDATPTIEPLKTRLADPLAALKAWDCRWAVSSVPTSLAVFYGEDLWQRVAADARRAGVTTYEYMESRATADQQLQSLAAAVDKLEADFGSWRTPWGDINRFQRVSGSIVQPFSDALPSLPVGFTASRWGSLAAFGARAYPGTKRWYGTTGNSFLAVVEFGETVRAKAVTAGGESGTPASPHFNDQAARYATGQLRDVYFHPTQLQPHTERVYHPGS
jgi:acyl-homoserine-lactone acylase